MSHDALYSLSDVDQNRAALPISAFWSDDMQRYVVYGRELRDGLCDVFFSKTPRDAWISYLGLATLLETNPPSDTPPAAVSPDTAHASLHGGVTAAGADPHPVPAASFSSETSA